MVLDYVRTLLWPAVLVFALLLFRSSFADLIGRFTGGEFEGPGGVKARAEFGERAAALQADVADDAARIITSPKGARVDTPASSDDRRVDPGDLTALLRKTAELGWLRGRLGDKLPPEVAVPAVGFTAQPAPRDPADY